MWHCLVNTRKIISRGKENWNISKNWSLGKVTCLLCYYTFPISYIYVQSYYMLKVNSAKPSDKYLFEIVNKSIKDCCQICFVKKVKWIKAKKSSLFSGNRPGENFFITYPNAWPNVYQNIYFLFQTKKTICEKSNEVRWHCVRICSVYFWPIKRQSHKMVKHTQTIRRQFAFVWRFCEIGA